ncbi:MAG: M20/M25/M40 family metallo-hydrolase [Verrucomicrobia bacterium]|nr:M20/M25/M40 family metallo-hydrolase [Verrucomicrobiota bacterium]
MTLSASRTLGRWCSSAVLLGSLFVLAVGAHAQTPPPSPASNALARQIVSDPKFRAAVGVYERDHERFVADLIKLTEIPAPPFGEEPRARAYMAMLKDAGLENVEMDAEGNVMGLWKGKSGGAVPLLAVAAHLDTVFPEGTDVKVKRNGTRLMAPGIGDDTRGLALLLALIRAMREAKVETAGDILFIGNVCEEGPGDLRGVRYLFTKGPWKDKIKRFITVDGGNMDIVTNSGLGSLRYKVTFKGPGGHSWGAFGNVSPAFAMGDAIARFGQLKVPKSPKVSYNVGIVSGGTSVNSIPFETAMEVDMRAVDPAALKDIDAKFKKIIGEAVEAENAARARSLAGRVGRCRKDPGGEGFRARGGDDPEHRGAAVRRGGSRNREDCAGYGAERGLFGFAVGFDFACAAAFSANCSTSFSMRRVRVSAVRTALSCSITTRRVEGAARCQAPSAAGRNLSARSKSGGTVTVRGERSGMSVMSSASPTWRPAARKTSACSETRPRPSRLGVTVEAWASPA